MVVVIRLQGLKITAGSEDIRSFFTGLRIPDGGVHIIGGELGEAFIIFASDEDARRAMTRSGGFIKDSAVNLLLSSRSEMQKVLEESTRNSEANNKRNLKEVVRRPAVGGRPMSLKENMKVDMRRGDNERMGNRPSLASPSDPRSQKNEGARDCLYLYLFGMPFSATKEDVHVFFAGIQLDDLIFIRNNNGMFNGCALVKFRTEEDAGEGLKMDRKYIGPRYVRVVPASEHQWVKSGGMVVQTGQRSRSRSRSPIRHRSHSPSDAEFGVLYENLPFSIEKRNIKGLLHPISLTDDQISIVDNKNGDGSKSAIVVFNNLKDYCSGLAHHKETFLHRAIYVAPVSREKIATMLKSADIPRENQWRSSRSSERSLSVSEKRFIYVRNLPFDVRKVEIMDFFHGFQLSEDKLILLHDDRGAGLGEALITFQSEKEAALAQSLNGQRFLGSEVMLKCITWSQMQEFDIGNSDIPKRNSPRYNNETNLCNEQLCRDNSGISDTPTYNPANSDRLGNFEDPAAYEGAPCSLDPHQYEQPNQQFNQPTRVRLLNLPAKIKVDEIYDFCYGYRVIPGSVFVEHRSRARGGTASVVFESHSEAVTAIQELNGRPIGLRKITVVFL